MIILTVTILKALSSVIAQLVSTGTPMVLAATLMNVALELLNVLIILTVSISLGHIFVPVNTDMSLIMVIVLILMNAQLIQMAVKTTMRNATMKKEDTCASAIPDMHLITKGSA